MSYPASGLYTFKGEGDFVSGIVAIPSVDSPGLQRPVDQEPGVVVPRDALASVRVVDAEGNPRSTVHMGEGHRVADAGGVAPLARDARAPEGGIGDGQWGRHRRFVVGGIGQHLAGDLRAGVNSHVGATVGHADFAVEAATCRVTVGIDGEDRDGTVGCNILRTNGVLASSPSCATIPAGVQSSTSTTCRTATSAAVGRRRVHSEVTTSTASASVCAVRVLSRVTTC